VLCEDVVEGMVAANSFRETSLVDPSIPGAAETELRSSGHETQRTRSPLEVVVDIERRDWHCRVEAGM
jgi:hypothetical protein